MHCHLHNSLESENGGISWHLCMRIYRYPKQLCSQEWNNIKLHRGIYTGKPGVEWLMNSECLQEVEGGDI